MGDNDGPMGDTGGESNDNSGPGIGLGDPSFGFNDGDPSVVGLPAVDVMVNLNLLLMEALPLEMYLYLT